MNNPILLVGIYTSQMVLFAEKLGLTLTDLSDDSVSVILDEDNKKSLLNVIFLYQSPWNFLRYQIQSSKLFLKQQKTIESKSKELMLKWVNNNRKLLQLNRHFGHQSLLFNIDMIEITGSLIELIKESFSIDLKIDIEKTFENADFLSDSELDNLPLFIKKISAESVDLYRELELSADLLGREPDVCFEMNSAYAKNLTVAIQQNFLIPYLNNLDIENKKLQEECDELNNLLLKETNNFQNEPKKYQNVKSESLLTQLQSQVVSLSQENIKLLEEQNNLKKSFLKEKTKLEDTLKILEESQSKSEVLLLQIHQMQEKLEEKSQDQFQREQFAKENKKLLEEKNNLKKSLSEEKIKLKDKSRQLEESQAEYELLFLQINQMREELEEKYQKNYSIRENKNLFENQKEFKTLSMRTDPSNNMFFNQQLELIKLKKENELLLSIATEFRQLLELPFLKLVWKKLSW